MLANERQPHLHRIRMTILDLNQPAERLALEVLLALLEDEIRTWDCPSLGDAW
jgi:hypothetical protein